MISRGGGGGLARGGIAAYYNVTFGGSDGRRPIFWGETEANENYVLCDGGSDGFGGKVPDLRGRMILGASQTYPEGTTGGSERHTHELTGTVGESTLSAAQLAKHMHNTRGSGNSGVQGVAFAASLNGSGYWTPTDYVGGSQSHTHALTASTAAADSLPPYYTLALIIRIS